MSVLGISAAIALAGWAGEASTASAQDEAARARARQLYGEAQALFDRGQYAQSEAQFRSAYEQVPNPVVLRAIALSQERQGNTQGAAETLRQYLSEAPQAQDRAEVQAHITELTGRPATMTINSTPPGARIVLDSADTQQVTPATLQMEGREHALELHLEGYSPHRQSFMAQPGARARLDITMQPGQDEPIQPPGSTGGGGGGGGTPDPSVGVWVAVGVAGLGLVSGTVFGFLALSEQSSFDDNPSNETADRGETFALVADISFGVAAAAAITGIVLYIVEATSGSSDTALLDDGERRLELGGWADPNGGGVAAHLAF